MSIMMLPMDMPPYTHNRRGSLIGFYSDVPQVGKSEAAKVARLYGYDPRPFAEPLKETCLSFLCQLGVKKEVAVSMLWGTGAEKARDVTIVPGVTLTGRRVMDLIGTALGRALIHPDLWVLAWKERTLHHLMQGLNVVVDDIRFANEADAVRALGGKLIKIVRPGVSGADLDPRVHGLLADYRFDDIVVNDGTLPEYRQKLKKLIVG
jgi:hypothetical protein